MWMVLLWYNGVFDLNLENFLIKDIVNILWGGYVIVRFFVNNLGI